MKFSFKWLRANHPDAAAAILASNGGDFDLAKKNWKEIRDAWLGEAVAEERQRCLAHARLGMLSGDIDGAIERVHSGAPIDTSVAEYLEHASSAAAEDNSDNRRISGTNVRPLAVALVTAAINRKDDNAN